MISTDLVAFELMKSHVAINEAELFQKISQQLKRTMSFYQRLALTQSFNFDWIFVVNFYAVCKCDFQCTMARIKKSSRIHRSKYKRMNPVDKKHSINVFLLDEKFLFSESQFESYRKTTSRRFPRCRKYHRRFQSYQNVLMGNQTVYHEDQCTTPSQHSYRSSSCWKGKQHYFRCT